MKFPPACRFCRHWTPDEREDRKPARQGYCMLPNAAASKVQGGWHWWSEETGLVTGPAAKCPAFSQVQPEDI